jgi:hypothetical protein
MVPQKMTALTCIGGNRQRQRVLKMSDDAERVTRESGTQISSNTSHIISFQEDNCSSDSNTRDANALETAHATIAQTAHRTTKISKSNIQYISEIELKSRPPPRTSLIFFVHDEFARGVCQRDHAWRFINVELSSRWSLISSGSVEVDVNARLPGRFQPHKNE